MTTPFEEATSCARRNVQAIISEAAELLNDLEYDSVDVAKSAHRRIATMSNDLGLLSVNLGERVAHAQENER